MKLFEEDPLKIGWVHEKSPKDQLIEAILEIEDEIYEIDNKIEKNNEEEGLFLSN